MYCGFVSPTLPAIYPTRVTHFNTGLVACNLSNNLHSPSNKYLLIIKHGIRVCNLRNGQSSARHFSCCQTKVLNRPNKEDYTEPNAVGKSGYFNIEKYLGKCHMDDFKVKDKNFIKSVEMSYKPISKKNKDTWTPKKVNICFSDGISKRSLNMHSYQCDKLESLGPFGPGLTTKDLINCKWHKGYCLRIIKSL